MRLGPAQLPPEAEAVEGGFELRAGHVALAGGGATRFYRHGWQSWSEARWCELSEPVAPIEPPERRPQADDPRYAEAPRHGGSGVGALAGADGTVLLLGALEPGARVEADTAGMEGHYEEGEGAWFLAYGAEDEVFAAYAERLGERLGRRPARDPAREPAPAPRLWSSWYGFYRAISEAALHEVLEGLRGLPFDAVQVDDGWQRAIGDWEANDAFPSGMQALAGRIAAAGFTPGLWLAPFIVRPYSRLCDEHPGWLLRDEDGVPVPAGVNWGGPFYALDTTHPEVEAWLGETLRRVRSWGFELLKLDFVYAAALPGARHRPVPRERAYRQALGLAREAIGDEAYLLACGAPILPSLGLADALRIGPDTAPYWDNEDRRRWLHDPTGPAARGALLTSLARLWLRPLVHLDPDVAFFRSRYDLLTPPQRRALQDLGLVAGFKGCSDPPSWLLPDEREALAAWLRLEPTVTRLGERRFRVDGRPLTFD
ncbi:MAG: alpha-galactosidase, partial [Deinococcales bacterium]